MTILEDRLAIQDVMTNYAAGVDDRDMAQYRRCFADDVEIVGFGGDAVVGADQWVAEVVEKLAAFGLWTNPAHARSAVGSGGWRRRVCANGCTSLALFNR